ncbi:MAG: Na/Pi cotransporter family protein [Lachnospiraceae bacterium]|nr:Na/Pi cotransporter family protein [Lachnospiraceae bacterium]
MSFFDGLEMIGGLALFLYGMHVLGDGLAKVSGGKLEKILEKLTSNPVMAVLVGAGVTAIIQSSSATTVMVVGFVNSGIMKLQQTVGIIIGANVGTTITAWLLSMSVIESGSFIIQLFKPSSFSPILAIIGVCIISFSKKEKKKDVALILVGFAVLMIGMDIMSGAVSALRDVPEFTQILTMFSNPILGLLAGLVLTAVIQSSSASVGILQALCSTGAVSFATAIPVIMGQNIGTCVTALISSVGTSKDARRAALIHLYYNILKTSSFMIVFYAIDSVVDFAFMETSISALGVAVVHSLFNIAACIVLLPFSKLLVRLVYITIPEGSVAEQVLSAEEQELKSLDVRFLDKPGYALDRCKHVAVTMAGLAKKSMELAMGLVYSYDKNVAKEVIRLEGLVDKYEDELGSYLVKLSSKDLTEEESQNLSVLLHSIGDFERISDHALNIKEAADEMHDKELEFSDKATEELQVFSSAVKEIMNLSFQVFEKEDTQMAMFVEPLEEVIDQLNVDVKKRHIKRLRKGKCTIELGFILSDITTNFERVSDHCSNLAVSLLQKGVDEFEAHEFMGALKREDNVEFQGRVMTYRKKYRLP